MKSNYINLRMSLIVIVFLSLLGCKKNFLDRPPVDRISSDALYKDEGLVENYLWRLYNTAMSGFDLYPAATRSGDWNLGTCADEARSRSSYEEDMWVVCTGLYNPQYNPLDFWGLYYSGIRIANEIITNLQSSPLEASFKARITSEARFIRAFEYFRLATSYGDVPLITAPQSLEDSILVSRTPQSDVYSFVDKELGEIGDILPSAANLPSSEYGRATREAAWALNGRNLLYAKNYSKSAEYSKKVMDANVFQLAPDYNALFQSYGRDPEVIYEVLYNGNGPQKGNNYDNFNVVSPYGTGYMGAADPTQEMVDAYEMTNGLPITDPASGYDPTHPYQNRDPRLKASIYYNGSVYSGHVLSMVVPDGPSAQDVAYYSTKTGYYVRKYIDESLGPVSYDFKGKTSWKELRLGEVLLNYAEAQNEAAGPDQTVYDAINAVRARVKMPGLPAGLSKDEMFERIIHERRIELAFEDFRWYDLIRWKRSEAVLNGQYFHGMRVTVPILGDTVYTVYSLQTFRPQQVFLPRNYLLPIPQGEIDKNPNLGQNTGY
jgi:starch-binding outer membrane protein, SusD/RagB family